MKNLIVTSALILLLFSTSAVMAQTRHVTQRPSDGDLGFDVIVYSLDRMSPMGTAFIRTPDGVFWKVRYLESDLNPGLTSKRELLYRVSRLN